MADSITYIFYIKREIIYFLYNSFDFDSYLNTVLKTIDFFFNVKWKKYKFFLFFKLKKLKTNIYLIIITFELHKNCQLSFKIQFLII